MASVRGSIITETGLALAARKKKEREEMEDVGKNNQDFDVFHVYYALQKCKVCMFVCACVCLSVSVHAGSHDVSFSH